jgi:hypothetical protein
MQKLYFKKSFGFRLEDVFYRYNIVDQKEIETPEGVFPQGIFKNRVLIKAQHPNETDVIEFIPNIHCEALKDKNIVTYDDFVKYLAEHKLHLSTFNYLSTDKNSHIFQANKTPQEIEEENKKKEKEAKKQEKQELVEAIALAMAMAKEEEKRGRKPKQDSIENE